MLCARSIISIKTLNRVCSLPASFSVFLPRHFLLHSGLIYSGFVFFFFTSFLLVSVCHISLPNKYAHRHLILEEPNQYITFIRKLLIFTISLQHFFPFLSLFSLSFVFLAFFLCTTTRFLFSRRFTIPLFFNFPLNRFLLSLLFLLSLSPLARFFSLFGALCCRPYQQQQLFFLYLCFVTWSTQLMLGFY